MLQAYVINKKSQFPHGVDEVRTNGQHFSLLLSNSVLSKLKV